MKIKIIKEKLISLNSPVLILPVFKDEGFTGQAGEIDKKLGGFLQGIISDGYYSPDLGQVHVVYTHDKIKTKKIVLAGLGKREGLDSEKTYRALSSAISYVSRTKTSHLSVFVGDESSEELQKIIETGILSLYNFHYHKSKKEEHSIARLDFVIEGKYDENKMKDISDRAVVVADAICKARDLANHPSNVLTPTRFVEESRALVKDSQIKLEVFDEKQMEKLGMGLFLSVSRGSDEDAYTIIFDYKPKKFTKTIALIGKGITFDSGGISIKPSDNMHEMKMDMSGAAAVFAVFSAIKKIKPEGIRIVGVIGVTENLPGHKAQKPGDIWKSYKGKTVEVLNTDAEGRLVLADLLAYADKVYRPEYMIDLATLTGACVVALGHQYSGLFTNNDKLRKILLSVSDNIYDKLWHMPIDEAFHDEIKSDVADLKNLGGREGGASTAAAFLEEFVNKETAWAHIDIAGTAMISKPLRAYESKGGTGAGVKMLIEFIKTISCK